MLLIKQANVMPLILVVVALTGCRTSQESAAISPSRAMSPSSSLPQGYGTTYTPPSTVAGNDSSAQGYLPQATPSQSYAPTGLTAALPSQQFSPTESVNSANWAERNSQAIPRASSSSSSSRCSSGCCN